MYFCEAGILFDFSEHVEQLDYAVTIPSVSGLETARFFVEHPVYGTTGYPTYEDACEDMHGILGFGQFLDSIESMIQAGFVGDHYIFNNQNMLVKVRSDYECWTWTPETGIVYDPEPEPEYPNRKQRRSARRKQNARHKKSDRLHGKGTYVYHYKEDGELKEAISGNEYRNWATWVRTMHSWGDPEGKKRKIPRTQSVNIHFTDGCTVQDVYNLTETDVHEYYSVSTWDGYESMENFFQYMDNMDWEKIPSEVRFSVEWYAENPFTADFPEPEYFEMNATLRKTQKTLSAEKAKEEYLKFKKRYQVFKRYAKKLHALYKEMNAELDA